MKIFKEHISPEFPIRYWFIVVIYFALSFIGILHHEIWLDEMHHYLLARDSNSLQELFINARYDGHPLLWNDLLFIITRFSHDPFYMQLLHIIISSFAVVVFLRNAPFTDFFKILFVFGYFMLYEYSIISRNYAVSILFLFIACSLICTQKRNYAVILLVLLILSYTHLFSLICSFSLFIVTLFIYKNDEENKLSKNKFLILCLGYLVIIGCILWSIIPPGDHLLIRIDTTPYLSFKRIGKAFSIFFKGLYHLPDFMKYNFWNTNLFVDLSKNFSIIPSVLCFIIPFFIFIDKPYSLALFYLSAIGIALFIFWSPIMAGVRYFGFIFLLLIIGLWFSKFPQIAASKKIPERLVSFSKRLSTRYLIPFVYSILFIQLASSVMAYSFDFTRPFSEGKAVASYLKENNLNKKIIAVNYQSSGPPISGYLDQKLYYPETNDSGSFCKWNSHWELMTKNELIRRIKKIDAENFILILSDSMLNEAPDKTIPVYQDDQLKIYFLASFNKATMRTENYRIYEVWKSEH